MSYDFSKLKQGIQSVDEWLKKEYTAIRTGMASPALLDVIKVESYGSFMPINQLANISVEDAKTLTINPWDSSQIKAIEKAITAANLGISLSVGGTGIRVIFPELTSERRTLLMKTAKERLEKARVSLRAERDETWDDIQKREKNKEMSEDDKFRAKEDMQKLIDEGNRKLEETFAKKEKEITI